MSEEQQKLPEIGAWHAQTIRLTAFPVDPGSVDGSTWWEQITGTEPESETKKKLQRQYDGRYQDSGLQLLIDPIRVQWSRFPEVDAMDLGEDFPNLGKLPAVSDSFVSTMEKWLVESPPLERLAFGAVLLQPVDNHESGYRRLNDYLPSVDLSPDTTDFSFSINRRRPSRCDIDGLDINRLMKWSLLHWEIGMNVIQGGNSPRQLAPASGFACRVELDINSAPDFEKIPRDELIPLWRELVQLAHEIAAGGDKP